MSTPQTVTPASKPPNVSGPKINPTITGEEIAKMHLDAGLCFVNDFVKSDPRLAFDVIKQSGYGRELSSIGMMEFVNIKTVVVKND